MSCTQKQIEAKRRFRARHLESERAKARERYHRNAGIRREKARLARAQNPEKSRAISLTSYYRRRPKALIEMSDWKKKNRPAINRYHRERYRKNPQAMLRARLASRLTSALKNISVAKSGPTLELIGISLTGLKAHIESQFLPGMSWDNRSLWHIDHRLPVSSFDLTDPQQQKECFHFTNLQSLWAPDNLSKGAKIAA